jgi:hypothetical protein
MLPSDAAKVLQQLPNQVDECQIKLMGKLKGASPVVVFTLLG